MNARVTIAEVPPPPRGWCRQGHVAPEWWRREGAGTPLVRTKFFEVSNTIDRSVNGTYCELHMVVAHHLADQAKKGLGSGR